VRSGVDSGEGSHCLSVFTDLFSHFTDTMCAYILTHTVETFHYSV
jgi:hypothetical protein